jgi:hypothetical protein
VKHPLELVLYQWGQHIFLSSFLLLLGIDAAGDFEGVGESGVGGEERGGVEVDVGGVLEG